MKRGNFRNFIFSSQFVSIACRYLPNAQVTPYYDAIQGGNVSVVQASWFASEQANKKWFRMRSSWFLFPTVVTFGGVMIYQTLPDENSYAYLQFMINTTGENECAENYLRWSSILVMTGFFEKLSQYDAPFYLIRSFVEHYLEFWYHTVFQENKNNRVYFRGEYRKSADELLSGRKHRIPLPYSLCSGEFSLSYVKDPTLEFANPGNRFSHPNGFTKGVISLTSSIEVTEVYGNAEAVLFVVPQGRTSPVAHHAIKDAQNFQYEYICGGIRRQDILFIGYRDLDTLEFNKVEFNPCFEGDIDKLELDPQMQSVIDTIPDHDSRKIRLKARINPALDYRDSYDQLVADDEHSHRQAFPERLNHIANHGFNGNKLLRSLHKKYHGVRSDHHGRQPMLVEPKKYFSDSHVAAQILKLDEIVFSKKSEEVKIVSPSKRESFSSPARTYSQLNLRAQAEMSAHMKKMAANHSKRQQDENLSSIVVSKRVVLDFICNDKSPFMPHTNEEEAAALDNFTFPSDGSVSLGAEIEDIQAKSLRLEDVLEVYSDTDSDSDNEKKSDEKNKRRSVSRVDENSGKVSGTPASSARRPSLFSENCANKKCYFKNAPVSSASNSMLVL